MAVKVYIVVCREACMASAPPVVAAKLLHTPKINLFYGARVFLWQNGPR